jgi:hypothetical protein|tara:strand:+ start:152 stop:835 length:684 start_codon:yes stop_codon:yes gene_type:complete
MNFSKLLLLCLFTTLSYAQYDVTTIGNPETLNNTGLWIINKPTSNKIIKGSPLVFSDIESSKFILKPKNSSKLYSFINGNYNSQTDQIVVKMSIDSVFSFDSNKIDYAIFNDLKMKRFSANTIPDRFYLFLTEGINYTLFKSYYSRITKGRVNPMTLVKVKPDKLEIFSKYFISINGADPIEFKLKKNTILKLLSERRDEVSSYASENRLSFSKEKDIIKIFQNFNK